MQIIMTDQVFYILVGVASTLVVVGILQVVSEAVKGITKYVRYRKAVKNLPPFPAPL